MASFPPITWITNGEDFDDYRPAIGPDGETVIFERKPLKSSVKVTLYRIVGLDGETAQPFVPGDTNALTRPDWCWTQNKIAYNSAQTGFNTVWQINDNGTDPKEVNNTANFIYPQWNVDGSMLTVMNRSKDYPNPNPHSTMIETNGTTKYANVNGRDQDGTPLFGGMPAVNPTNELSIAFAGQPINWSKEEEYHQDKNYIFLNSFIDDVFSSAPMEQNAPIESFHHKFQGRAPAWSPNGRYIVFESDRDDSTGQYALYLFDTQGNGTAPQPLTDTEYNAQHAKFFPNGTMLIFAGKPTSNSSFGIGWIDISKYVANTDQQLSKK